MGGAELETLSCVYDEAPSTKPSLRTAASANANAGGEGIVSLGYKSVELFCSAILLKNYSAYNVSSPGCA